MNHYSPITIKSIFKEYGIKPKKYLGQNFVINKSVIDNIVKTADLNANDTIIEIGPGLGALTIELAKKTKKVIAIEKDAKICEILQNILIKNKIDNVSIVNQDILRFSPFEKSLTDPACRQAGEQKYKVVANIPYYITQPIIRLFLEFAKPPESITLLVQKEVAQRICAIAPKMNLLAVSVQFYAQPEIISYVSKNNFWPQPKVDSAILKISQIHPPNFLNNPLVKNGDILQKVERVNFFKTVRAGFSSPRKMLIGNINKKLEIPRETILKIYRNIGIDPAIRAENLTIKKWQELSIAIFSHTTENMI
ncbi:MAG: 16S rRNA (adenine(1518)-N(6)/adenine(1519)-N(6))-dimethyltransferase RsmA [Patescibacteria group bacterium]